MEKLVQILLYAGAVQGFMLAIGLNVTPANTVANRVLGMLSGLWGVVLLVFVLQFEGLYDKYPNLLLVFDQLIILIFPLYYLYAKYLLSSQQKYAKKDLLHFVPFVLSILANITFFIEPEENKQFLVDNPTPYMSAVEIVSNEVVSFQSIFYLLIILSVIRNYKRRIKDFQSNSIIPRIHLIEIGTLIILVAWSTSIIGWHLDLLGIDIGFDYFLGSYLSFVFVIYFTSYASFSSPEIFKIDLDLLRPTSAFRSRISDKNTGLATDFRAKREREQSDRTDLENVRNEALNKALLDYMEKEEPYLSSELTLIDLAKELSTTRNDLSNVINSLHKVNFYEFINQYRVEKVKALMNDKANNRFKMMSLGFAAGFNSKASFYRVFRQFTNMSPSEYFKSLDKDNQLD